MAGAKGCDGTNCGHLECISAKFGVELEQFPVDVPEGSMAMAAIAHREMFVSYRMAGFTEDQALKLTAYMTIAHGQANEEEND